MEIAFLLSYQRFKRQEKLMPYAEMKHPAAKNYLRQTKWEHRAAALYLKAMGPEVYRRYNDRLSVVVGALSNAASIPSVAPSYDPTRWLS